MRRYVFTIAIAMSVVLSTALPTFASDFLTLALFSPESFIRDTGSPAPAERTFHVPSTQGNFTLTVLNGDGSGDNTASSAVIKVNGVTIVRTSDLNQNVSRLDLPLSNLTQGTNTLSVEVRSIPSSYVTVSVTGEYLLDIAIADPAEGAEVLSDRATVTGTYASYTGDVFLSVNGTPASLGGGTFTAFDIPLSSGGSTLTATITTADGISDQDTLSVTSNRPPLAAAGQDRIVTAGDTVVLDGSGSFDPENGLITYAWEVLQQPSSSISSLSNSSSVIPSFVPDFEGIYIFSLVVSDGRSESAPDNVTITAEHPNVAPTANAGADQSVATGSQVYLGGTGSLDPEGTPLQFNWAFLARPAESAASLSDPSSAVPSFVADRDGVYLVELSVSDGELSSLPDIVTVIAATPNAPPVANAGQNTTVLRNSVIHLDGTPSSDPDGDPLTFFWNIVSKPQESVSLLDDAASATPTILADAEGDYVFRLTVGDGIVESEPVPVVVTSVNDPPVADSGVNVTVPRNTAVALDGSGSTDGNGDPLTYLWSLSLAPSGSTATIGNPTAVTPLFMPELAGQYVIHLVVSDGLVDSAPDSLAITAAPLSVSVPDVAGMAQASGESTIVAAGLAVGAVVTANSDTVPAGSIVSQNPTGGSIAPEGTSVDLVVSLGPVMVTVPNVAGMTQAGAQSSITGAGLSVGAVTQVNSATVPAGSVISQNPAAGTDAFHGSSVDIVVSLGPVMVTVPDVSDSLHTDARAMIVAAGLSIGAVAMSADETVAPWFVAAQNPAAGAIVPQGAAVDLTVSLGPSPSLPPDPASVAPPLSGTTATTTLASAEFLFSGASPIQTGVEGGTIELERAAVLRGTVNTRDGLPLPGVAVNVPGHPEYGQTVTRSDGVFDLAVNGGAALTVTYRKTGYLTVQRQANVEWQEQAVLPDVVMTVFDEQVTTIDLAAASAQVARGSVVTDADGARRATLLFAQGTHAQMTMPDGSSRPLSKLNVRATEYTVGTSGPVAMPADLPAASAYTYCVEFSVDEAIASGATGVSFDRTIYGYVENFLNLPVGAVVPSGYYDRTKGVWIPSPDGRIIKVMSVTGGLADLDTDGNGSVDDTTILAAQGVTGTEREQLALLYQPGASLWRVPMTHFTPYDWNWPYELPPDAIGPTLPKPGGQALLQKPCRKKGSVIECENQVLGEMAGVTGTPYSLHYQSDRVSGRKDAYSLKIFLSGGGLPPSLRRILLDVYVAGRRIRQIFPAQPNQTTTFTWDGLDVYGRKVQGKQNALVRLGYVYRGMYTNAPPQGAANVFAGFGGGVVQKDTTRGEITLWQEWRERIGNLESRDVLGGWTVDVHHTYDPGSRILHLGDGTRRGAVDRNRIITTIAGTGTAGYNGENIPATQAKLNGTRGIDVGPDGTVYFAEMFNNRVRRITPDGLISTVAGTGATLFNGDNIPATQASLAHPDDVAVGPDGSVYIADVDHSRIRRVGPDGIITTVGTGFVSPQSVDVAPDGSIFVGDYQNNTVYRVGTSGVVTHVVGNPYGTGCNFSRVLASSGANIHHPISIAAAPDGNLYVDSVGNDLIHRISIDGYMTHFAGSGWDIYCQRPGTDSDGVPATQALLAGWGLASGRDGSLYIAERKGRIRKVGKDSIITTVAGTPGIFGFSGDGGPATLAALNEPMDVAEGPDGSLYITDWKNYRIRRVAPPFPWLSGGEIAIASEDGSELYVFDAAGRHLRTVNAMTAAEIYRFGYDSDGLLSRITDGDNNETAIDRDFGGNPIAIIAPGGQRTEVALDNNGFLARIANPAGESLSFGYTSDGLLTSLIDANQNTYTFDYDAMGRLERDEDPEGGFTTLTRTETMTSYTVTTGTALGRVSGYKVENLATGAMTRTVTDRFGGKTTMSIGTGGNMSASHPDGSTSTLVEGPDPRFGMESPVPRQASLKSPAGLTATVTTTRTATLADPNNSLSLSTLTETATLNGKAHTSYYNASSREISYTTPAGRQTITGIDNQGRVLSVNFDSSTDNAIFAYDPKGRLAQASQSDKTWAYTYDDLNRLTSVTDPLSHSLQYGYDNADRVARVILPSGRTYGFLHDNNGNVTSITMPSGAVHGLGYTKINMDNSYTPPGNPAYATNYNLDREWVRTTLPSGRAIDGGYDNGGRLHDVTYPEGAVTLSYFDNTDRVGTITRTVAPVPDNTTQTLAFSYDGFLTTRIAYSGVANGEYRYAFDNNFWVTGVALDNVWTTLARDNDGLLTRYGPFTITRSGPAGAPSALTDNTLNISYTYDSFGRLFTRTHTVNSIPVYQLTLGYDNVGRISTKTEVVSGSSHVFDYTYDVDGQLFEVRKDGILGEQYGYDNNANRTSTLAATASYDEQDRLIEHGGVAYTFDADGYLTNRGSDTFSYSARGELLSATVGGQTITYQNDGIGRRIAKTDAAGTTQYLYGNPGNPFQLTASRDAAGILTTYFYDVAGNLYAFERGGVRYYVATDQLGTPKVVTDNAGNTVKVVEHDAWGVKLSDSDPAFELPVAFAGGVPDSVAGLVRFGFRDYEPGTGRWIARDPIYFRGGQGNLYEYVGNSPETFKDSTGLGPLGDETFEYPDPGWQATIGINGSLGAAVFGGGGVNIGITSSGQVMIQFQASLESGVGAFAGIGVQGGLSHSSCPIPSGISVNRAGQADFNIGAGALTRGGSVQYGPGGVGGGRAFRGGVGYGIQASAGFSQTVTIATPALW